MQFVVERFKMIMQRDYNFNPKTKQTPAGVEFTITVSDQNLRRFISGLTYPKTIGTEMKIDRESGTKYKANIVKDVTFIRCADISDPCCNTLKFCIDTDANIGATKMNVIEHGLRTYIANNRSNSTMA